MRVRYYQVYENGDKDMIMVDGSAEETDRRRHIPRGAVVVNKDVDDVEAYRDEVRDIYKELGKEVTIILAYETV